MKNEYFTKSLCIFCCFILLGIPLCAQGNESPEEQKIRANLQKNVAIDFSDTPFLEVVEFLNTHGINIVVDPDFSQNIEAEAIKVTLVLKHVSIKLVLDILSDLHEFHYIISKDGILLTHNLLKAYPPVTRNIEIGDLQKFREQDEYYWEKLLDMRLFFWEHFEVGEERESYLEKLLDINKFKDYDKNYWKDFILEAVSKVWQEHVKLEQMIDGHLLVNAPEPALREIEQQIQVWRKALQEPLPTIAVTASMVLFPDQNAEIFLRDLENGHHGYQEKEWQKLIADGKLVFQAGQVATLDRWTNLSGDSGELVLRMRPYLAIRGCVALMDIGRNASSQERHCQFYTYLTPDIWIPMWVHRQANNATMAVFVKISAEKREPVPISTIQPEKPDDIRRKLYEERITLDFSESPLVEIIDFLRSLTMLNILIDPDVFREYEEEALKCDINVNDIRLGTALNILLSHHNLSMVRKHDCLVITPASKLRNISFRLYSVKELCMLYNPQELREVICFMLRDYLDFERLDVENGYLLTRLEESQHQKLEEYLYDIRYASYYQTFPLFLRWECEGNWSEDVVFTLDNKWVAIRESNADEQIEYCSKRCTRPMSLDRLASGKLAMTNANASVVATFAAKSGTNETRFQFFTQRMAAGDACIHQEDKWKCTLRAPTVPGEFYKDTQETLLSDKALKTDTSKDDLQLRNMAVHRDKDARKSAASHPRATVDILQKLGEDENWEVRYSVALHPNTPLACLQKLASDVYWPVRYAVASHPNLPMTAISQLVGDEIPKIRERVAQHPKISEDALAQLLSGLIKLTCVQHNWNEEEHIASILGELSQHHLVYVRLAVAKNENATEEILAKLSADSSEAIRIAVAGHANVYLDVLEKLCNDPEENVRIAAVLNPKALVILKRTHSEIHLAQDSRWYFRLAVAQSQSTDSAILTSLAQDENEKVRIAVAANTKTPSPALEMLKEDPSPEVSEAAIENLRLQQEKPESIEEKPESSEEKSEESTEEKPESTEEKPEESSKEKPQESSEEKPQESSEEKPEESSEEKPQESTEEKPEESTEEKPQESTEEKPQESTEEKPQESTEEKPQE